MLKIQTFHLSTIIEEYEIQYNLHASILYMYMQAYTYIHMYLYVHNVMYYSLNCVYMYYCHALPVATYIVSLLSMSALFLSRLKHPHPPPSHHSHTLPSPLPPLTHPPPSLQGVLCRTLQGHGHWVNTMALSTDYALRTGAFDPSDRKLEHCGVEGMSCEYHVTSHVTILHLLFIHTLSLVEELKIRSTKRYNTLKVRLVYV